MKHLFYIHSYITYYVGLEVTKHHHIDHGDCVFLYGRKFRPLDPPADIRQAELPFTHHPINSFAVERRFWKGWKKLDRFDLFVQELVKEEEFKIYTNQTGIDFIRLFISHKNCRGFSFLEEGLASYYSLNHMNAEVHPSGSSTLTFKILLLLNFKARLSPQKLFYSTGYDNVYGVSEASFPHFERKVRLALPFFNNLPMPDYEHILVLDAASDYGFTSSSIVLSALAEALQHLIKNSIEKIFVKYHPEQASSIEVKEQYKQVFQRYSQSLTIEEIPQYVSLELVAGNAYNTKTVFYIFLSSVGLYAGLCGREVYSFASYVSKRDQQYKQWAQHLPSAFKEKVKFL